MRSAATSCGGCLWTRAGNFLARRRRAAITVLSGAAIAWVVYFVVPQIADLGPTLRRLRAGDAWWLALGALLELVSIIALVAVFGAGSRVPVTGSDGA
jgi:hypothetical protein